MKYQVKEETTLLEFLIQVTSKKKNDLKQLLKFKNVYVDGIVQTHVAYSLKVGQVVEIQKASKQTPVPIIYEDKDLVVIDKPCGLLSERTNQENQKTAFSYINTYLSQKGEKAYLVHRLDQYTSGVLMFVKSKKLYDLLTNDWNKYVKTRGYVAVVEGQVKKNKGTIENYLGESKTQVVHITSKDKGKKAITHYKVIKSNRKFSLLEVYLDTGRKNQIRVHMSSMHHPIVGDDKYGSKVNPLKRLGLHAHEFAFTHPLSGKVMRFVSKTPETFENLFK